MPTATRHRSRWSMKACATTRRFIRRRRFGRGCSPTSRTPTRIRGSSTAAGRDSSPANDLVLHDGLAMLIRHMPLPAVVSLPRRFVSAAIGGLLLLLAACGGKPDDSAASGTSATEEKVLNVYNWADYIEPKVLEDFQKETGIKVRYDVFDSNEVLETKLLTGDSGYDVVVPSAYFLERQIKAGVFQPLDKTQLPHLQNQDPELQAVVAKHDPDNAHSVIYMWGTTGIGYDAL